MPNKAWGFVSDGILVLLYSSKKESLEYMNFHNIDENLTLYRVQKKENFGDEMSENQMIGHCG